MACSVDGTQAAIFTTFHCVALLMSQSTPLTGGGFCVFVAALCFLVLGLTPLSVLALFDFLCCLLVFRPFLQWIHAQTSI